MPNWNQHASLHARCAHKWEEAGVVPIRKPTECTSRCVNSGDEKHWPHCSPNIPSAATYPCPDSGFDCEAQPVINRHAAFCSCASTAPASNRNPKRHPSACEPSLKRVLGFRRQPMRNTQNKSHHNIAQVGIIHTLCDAAKSFVNAVEGIWVCVLLMKFLEG